MIIWLWQFPQNILGFVLTKILKGEWKVSGSLRYYLSSSVDAGVSLGNYIIVPSSKDLTLRHEHGHQIQSKRFGLFYLLIVGVPSVINNLWHRLFHSEWSYAKGEFWYYKRWPEKQADELGGIVWKNGKRTVS